MGDKTGFPRDSHIFSLHHQRAVADEGMHVEASINFATYVAGS